MNKKNLLTLFIKLSLAFALIYWSYKKGYWDFEFISTHLSNPLTLIGSILLLMFNLFILGLRWQNLIRHTHEAAQNTPLYRYIQIIWISCFFNSFLPGSVAGDLLRFRYKNLLSTQLKTSTVLLTTGLDRILGLLIMLLLTGIAPWFLDLRAYTNSNFLAQSLELAKFITFIPLAFYLALLIPYKTWSNTISKIPYLKDSHKKLILKFHGMRKAIMINSLLIVVMHISLMSLFLWWASDQWSTFSEASLLISMTSLCLVFIAVPISPAGAGVGHVLFEKFYSAVGFTQGANLFNLFFLINLFINLVGIIPFILTKTSSSSHQPKKLP